MIIHNRKLDYLLNHRLAFIQKREEPYYHRIQLYNNNLMDKKVNDKKGVITDPFKESAIFSTIYSLNKPSVVRDFQRILKSPYTSDSKAFELLTKTKIDKTTRIISEIETQRVIKNLNYVEKVMSTTEINIDKFNKMAKSFPKVNRARILEKALEKGRWFKSSKDFNYKQLESLQRGLAKHKTHLADYEKAIAENDEAIRNGFEAPNPTKTWIWSHLDKTRHSGMDGETVYLRDMFEVVNEVSGDVDYLRFPGDVENDTSGCSNICGCQCTYIVN